MREYLPSLLLVEVACSVGDLLVSRSVLGHAEFLLGGVETWGSYVSFS